MSENDSGQVSEEPEPGLKDAQSSRKSQTVVHRKSKTRSRILQGISLLVLVIVVLLSWHFLGGNSNKAASRARGEVIPVEIAAATQMEVPVQIKSIGNIESLSTIAVRSQIEI